jgi:hypothetical protein
LRLARANEDGIRCGHGPITLAFWVEINERAFDFA